MCVQYIGGCSVHRGVFSTLGEYHKYIRGISWVHGSVHSVRRRGYHEYIGRCSVHWIPYYEYIGEISWVHWGDIMSTSGDVGDIQYIGVFNRNWKDFNRLLPHMHHDIPPMYWTSPDVLMISPRCTHGVPPTFIMLSPDVLNISVCTH